MARWIEVPAHRVLEITDDEFLMNFEEVNAEGKPIHFGEMSYRIIRKSDGKMFCYPRFHASQAPQSHNLYLEEI